MHFDKCRVVLALGFSFSFTHLKFITDSLNKQSNTYTQTLTLDISYLHFPEVVQKYNVGYTLTSILRKAGPKRWNC
jgi:hypothetical protein